MRAAQGNVSLLPRFARAWAHELEKSADNKPGISRGEYGRGNSTRQQLEEEYEKRFYRHQRMDQAGAARHHRTVACHQKGHQGRVLSAADAEHDARHDFSAVQHAHARFV